MTNLEVPAMAAIEQLDERLIYLAPEDMRVAGSVLLQTYQTDPQFQFIARAGKKGYQQRLRALIREELLLLWHKQQPMFGVFQQDRLEALVCLTRPHQHLGAKRSYLWRLNMWLTAGFTTTKRLLEKEALIEQLLPTTNYYLIVFLAVQPRDQHHGLGHRLLTSLKTYVAEHEQADGVDVFITREEYEPLFKAQGYRGHAEINQNGLQGKLLCLEQSRYKT